MTVKFYDPKTETVTEIPSEELAPGCVKVRITGMDGEYFVLADSLKTGPIRQPELDPNAKEKMVYLENVFKEVYHQSADDWEEGFRQDTDPESEIAIWMLMAKHFEFHTRDRDLSLEAKKDYFAIILQFINCGEQHVRETVSLGALPESEMKEVIRLLKQGLPE